MGDVQENDKLYLRGHGNADVGKEPKVGDKTAQELAEILQKKGLQPGKVIKVVGCFSGYKHNPQEKTFVDLLGEALKSFSIKCKSITGITDKNVVDTEGKSRAKRNTSSEQNTAYEKFVNDPRWQQAREKALEWNLKKLDDINLTIEIPAFVEKSTLELWKELCDWTNIQKLFKDKTDGRYRWLPDSFVEEKVLMIEKLVLQKDITV